MTTIGSTRVEYPTLFVPSHSTPIITELPSPATSETAIKVDFASTKMAGDKSNAQNSGWFTAFTAGGVQMSNSGESSDQSPATAFSAQTAASWLGQRYRPWTEFFKTTKFGLPKLDIAVPRVQRNLNNFLANYLCISVVLLVYCVLTSFILLLALIALAGLFYTIRQKTLKGPVVIAGNELPPSLLYSLAIIVCVPLFYLSGATGIIGWIIGTSAFLIFLHSVLYVSEEQPGAEFEVVTIA